MSLRIVLVDDHVVFLEALTVALAQEEGLAVVGHAHEARTALRVVEETKPDVAVLDITLRGPSGLSLAREILRGHRRTRCLMLTMHTAPTSVAAAIAAGAAGYASKASPIGEVVRAIRLVAAGERYLAPQVADELPDEVGLRGVASLSNREKDVFDLAVNLYPNKEIAKHLCISVKTVETHRIAINRKLAVHSPSELVLYAAMHGLLLGRPGGSGHESE